MIRSPFELPEYSLALERERVGRVLAFHRIVEHISGFALPPLTLRQYSLLRLVDSPFIPPYETPTTQQLIQFIWILNPHFCAGESAEKTAFFARARKLFIPPAPPRWQSGLFVKRWYYQRKACEIREAQAIEAARKFMADTLSDRPESTGGYQPSYYSDECSIIGALSRENGWREEEIMELPLVRIFQHLKRIHETVLLENGLPVLFSNPSDNIIQSHLAAENQKN